MLTQEKQLTIIKNSKDGHSLQLPVCLLLFQLHSNLKIISLETRVAMKNSSLTATEGDIFGAPDKKPNPENRHYLTEKPLQAPFTELVII